MERSANRREYRSYDTIVLRNAIHKSWESDWTELLANILLAYAAILSTKWVFPERRAEYGVKIFHSGFRSPWNHIRYSLKIESEL